MLKDFEDDFVVEIETKIEGLVARPGSARNVLFLFYSNLVDLTLPTSPLHLSNFPFPARLMYNLGDGENWGAIAVNLLPLLASEVQHRGKQQSQRSKAHRQGLLNRALSRLHHSADS